MSIQTIDMRVVATAWVSNLLVVRYGKVPVSVSVAESTVMRGYDFRFGVEGASRTVFVSTRRWNDQEERESITDELLFAVFLLLDQDEDEEDVSS